jgi:hypothetical protein
MRAVTGVLVALHIVAAVVGFGAVAMTGALALTAARDPSSPAAARYFRPGPNWASYLVFLVPVCGAGLEASSGWGDVHFAWPWIALGIWLVAAATGSAHWPAERRLQGLLAAGAGAGPNRVAPETPQDTDATRNLPRDPEAAGAAGDLLAACRRTAWSSAVMTTCFVAALVVMVVQPR